MTTVLQSGNREAQRTSIIKLRRVAQKLYKSKRFARALEVGNEQLGNRNFSLHFYAIGRIESKSQNIASNYIVHIFRY